VNRDVHNPATVVGEDHQREQQPTGGRRHDEQVRSAICSRWFGKNVRHV
jgi:hypothetical protein